MVEQWRVSAPVIQARVEPVGDYTLNHTLTLTMTFDVEPGVDGPGPYSKEHGAARTGPLRLALPLLRTPEEKVSLGVLVPNVVGSTERDAQDTLEAAGLRPVHGPTGHILTTIVRVESQDPLGGTWAAPGSEVRLEYGEGESIPEPGLSEKFVICNRVSCEDPLHDPNHLLNIELVIGG